MSRAPSGPPPLSKEDVSTVVKRRAAPKGPPPAGMSAAFGAPKQYPSRAPRNNDARVDDPDESFDGPFEDFRDSNQRAGRRTERDDYNRSNDERDYRNERHSREENYRLSNNDQYQGSSRVEDHNSHDNHRRRAPSEDHRDRESSDGRHYNNYDERDQRSSRYADNHHGNSDSRRTSESRDLRSSQPSRGHHNRNDSSDYNVMEDENARMNREHDNEEAMRGDDSYRQMQKAQARRAMEPGPHSKAEEKSSGSSSSAPKKPVNTKHSLLDFGSVLQATYRELRHFVMSPLANATIARCYIERNRSGANALCPSYSLCADLEDGTGRELIVCKKVLQSMSSHYVFSLKQEDLYRNREQRSRLYLGKLRSVSSNEYVLYDSGSMAAPSSKSKGRGDKESPDERDVPSRQDDKATDDSLYRKDLCTIVFNSKTRPAAKNVRPMELCIPQTQAVVDSIEGNAAICKMIQDNEESCNVDNTHSDEAATMERKVDTQFESFPVSEAFAEVRKVGLQNMLSPRAAPFVVFHERTSRYDPLSSCLVDFHGRANAASVKNFQVTSHGYGVCQVIFSPPVCSSMKIHGCVMSTGNPRLASDSSSSAGAKGEGKSTAATFLQDPEDSNLYVLQMGKTTSDCFNMDYKSPLSMFQAFAICVARLDANIKW